MKRICFFSALIASSAVGIMAQDNAKPDDLFKQLDKNNDGKLVRSEVPEDQVRHFERLLRVGDEDKNGELSKSEFDKATSTKQDEPRRAEDAGPGGRPGPGNFDPKQMFERMDQNKDGKVSRNELPEFARERLGRVFDELKKDELTFEEFEKAREKLGPPPEGGRPGMGDPAETFKRMDSNNDGKLTLEEVPERAKQFLAPMFERLGKKEITKDEFVAAAERFRGEGGRRPEAGAPDGARRPDGNRPPEGGPRPDAGRGEGGFRGPRILQLLDKDRNGRVSREELARAASLFEELDENKDGDLDPRELLGPPPQGAPGAGPEGPNGRRPEGGDRPPMPPGAGRPESARPRESARRPGAGDAPRLDGEMFKRLDQNGDGKISKQEAPERLQNNFERADTNKDGVIDAEEFKKMAEQVGERRRPN